MIWMFYERILSKSKTYRRGFGGSSTSPPHCQHNRLVLFWTGALKKKKIRVGEGLVSVITYVLRFLRSFDAVVFTPVRHENKWLRQKDVRILIHKKWLTRNPSPWNFFPRHLFKTLLYHCMRWKNLTTMYMYVTKLSHPNIFYYYWIGRTVNPSTQDEVRSCTVWRVQKNSLK